MGNMDPCNNELVPPLTDWGFHRYGPQFFISSSLAVWSYIGSGGCVLVEKLSPFQPSPHNDLVGHMMSGEGVFL